MNTYSQISFGNCLRKTISTGQFNCLDDSNRNWTNGQSGGVKQGIVDIGTLLPSIFSPQAIIVVQLWLYGCQLTGSIPSELGCLESVGTHSMNNMSSMGWTWTNLGNCLSIPVSFWQLNCWDITIRVDTNYELEWVQLFVTFMPISVVRCTN
jgi:hypothetical protein